MRTTVARITKRTVDALAPAERERVVWGDNLKGFSIRIHPTVSFGVDQRLLLKKPPLYRDMWRPS